MSRTTQPHHTASEAEDEFNTWWRNLWRIFAVQWTLNNLCFLLFIDRQIPQIVEFIEGGGPESSQHYVSICQTLGRCWALYCYGVRSEIALVRPTFRGCVALFYYSTFDGHQNDVGLIWTDLIRLFAWNYRYSISDSLRSRPDKNACRIQLISPQRRKMDLMLIRMRCSFCTGSLLEITFVTFSCPLERMKVGL